MYEAQDLGSGREYALKVTKDGTYVGFWVIPSRSLSDSVSGDLFLVFSLLFFLIVHSVFSL